MADNQPKEPEATPKAGEGEQGNPAEPRQQFAGKYNSIEDLEKGYWELSKEGLAQRDARVKAEAERDALLDQLQRHTAPPPSNQPDILAERFAEAEIPIEALDARVEAKALEVLQQALRPVTAMQEAEGKMLEKYPDFPGMQELQRGLDPGVADSFRRVMASDPQGAMELAYHAWKPPAEPAAPSIDPVKKAAASTQPRSGGAREPEPDRSQQRYDQLLEQAKFDGDWTKFLRHRFGDQEWYKGMVEPENRGE